MEERQLDQEEEKEDNAIMARNTYRWLIEMGADDKKVDLVSLLTFPPNTTH